MSNPIQLPHSVVVRAPGLLPMLYTVSELSALLHIPDRTLRDWLAAKEAPHNRDNKNHIWINGTEFSAWVYRIQHSKTRSGSKLSRNEAYCFRCRRRVKLLNPGRKHIQGDLAILQGQCPNCGCTINRGSRKQDELESQEK